MAKISEEFASKYLKAEDLKGKDVALKITEAELVEFDDEKNPGRKKKKVRLSFAKTDKQMILNVTNCDIVAELHGDDTDDWIGQYVTLFPTKVQYGNERVLAIRIRDVAPPIPAKNGQTAHPVPVVVAVPVVSRQPGDDFEDDNVPF